MSLFKIINKSETVDKTSFLSTLIVVTGLASIIFFDQNNAKSLIESIVLDIKEIFGPFYLLLALICFVFLLYVAMSKVEITG